MTSNDPFGPPTRMLELRDCRLPYWRIGRGPDLVFVHGWPLDARTWRHCVSALSERYTCHLFDLPGAGCSEWTDQTRIGVAEFGIIVTDAIEAMEISTVRFGLIGQDTGGSYARLAAARMPERIAGIALGNTEIPGYPSWRLKLLFSLGMLKGLEPLLRRALAARLGRSLFSITASQNKELLHGEITDLFLRPLIENNRALSGAASILRFIRVEDFDQVGDAHPKIMAPVRLIWGRQDPWFPLKSCQLMRKTFGGYTDLVVLDHAKLLVHEEHPKRFSQALEEHFAVCLPQI